VSTFKFPESQTINLDSAQPLSGCSVSKESAASSWLKTSTSACIRRDPNNFVDLQLLDCHTTLQSKHFCALELNSSLDDQYG
jgi:hypothetical protein